MLEFCGPTCWRGNGSEEMLWREEGGGGEGVGENGRARGTGARWPGAGSGEVWRTVRGGGGEVVV